MDFVGVDSESAATVDPTQPQLNTECPHGAHAPQAPPSVHTSSRFISKYPLHSLFYDVCFKLRHLKKQNKRHPIVADRDLPPNHSIVVPNTETLKFIMKPENQAPKDSVKECSNFDVDKELGFVSKKYDITALGGAFCRHGFCGVAHNVFTGERYSYALMALYIILFQHQLPILFFWYDVNCRFKSRFSWWVDQLRNNGHNIPLEAHELRFPVPPFHINAHGPKCQEQNAHTLMEGAGRPPGEPPEIIWSKLGELGKTIQYMSRVNRQGVIERKLAVLHNIAVDSLPALLMRMGARAVEQVITIILLILHIRTLQSLSFCSCS